MQINCIICSDLFTNSSELFTTKCGHIFHHHCLIQWLERSRTCPQCRVKNSENSIHRVYFNIASGEGIEDDKATLQFKLDNMHFNMRLKDVDIKNLKEKNEKAEVQVKGLVAEVKKLEKKARENETTFLGYREQLGFYKNRAKDLKKVEEELEKCKIKLRNANDIQAVINGSEEEARETIKYNRDPESLALMLTTVKKQLVDLHRQKKKVQSSLRHRDEEMAQMKREIKRLSEENDKLKIDVGCHKNCEAEKKYIKKQLEKSEKEKCDNCVKNEHTKRIITESPVPIPKDFQFDNSLLFNATIQSPSVEDRLKETLESDSPYLRIKSAGLAASTVLSQAAMSNKCVKKNTFKIIAPGLFKKGELSRKAYDDAIPDGMGGYTREEKFPSPKKNELKRPKSTIPPNKFRKLAPHKTLHDYIRMNET